MNKFGQHVRHRRERLRSGDPAFSVRRLASRIGVEPSYLSKIERGIEAPPSETTIRALARELDEDPDFLLGLAGKVADDLRRAICRRPRLIPSLIREVDPLPDTAVQRIVHSARRRRSEEA